MKKRISVLLLLLAILFMHTLLSVTGCTSTRHKLDEYKQHFLSDIMRW